MTVEVTSAGKSLSEAENIRSSGNVPDVDKILSQTDDFEKKYINSGPSPKNPQDTQWFQKKFNLSVALIKDGRYSKRHFLIEHFIPSATPIDPGVRQFAQEHLEELKLLLIETGDIDTKSDEGKAVGITFAEKFKESGEMSKYAAVGIPPEVAAQIAILEHYKDLTDEKKLEELRSWATHAFYRPYIGLLSGVTPIAEPTVTDLVSVIPHEIFTNTYALRYNLIELFFEEQFRQDLNKLGVNKGISHLEEEIQQIDDEDKRDYLAGVYERVYDMITTPTPPALRAQITVKGQERPFPSVDQMAFAYCYEYYGTRFLWGKAGLGKTNAIYNVFEQVIREVEPDTGQSEQGGVLVLVPATGRETWQIEEDKVFVKPGNVFIVRTSDELDKAIAAKKKYTVVSHELLGRAKDRPEILAKLHTLIERNNIIGSAIDEIDGFSNPTANCTEVAIDLLGHIRQNYWHLHGQGDVPIIGLTATPFKTGFENLNAPMAMLYPNEYVAIRGEATEFRKTFSDNCLENPYLIYLKLFGERRMFSWEKAAGVQPFGYETMSVEASPFERELYSFIENHIGGDALNKIRLLENGLFNPLLVKNEVRRRMQRQIPVVDLEQVAETLKKTLAEWKKIRGVDSPQSEADYLSVDQLINLGLGELVIGCFFNEVLTLGIDSFVDQLAKTNHDPEWQDLKRFWRSYEISTKYRAIKALVDDALTWRLREDGTLVRQKIIIASPSRMQGRTGDVLQRVFTSADGNDESLYSQEQLDRINDLTLVKLIRQWASEKGFTRSEDVVLIDGSVSIGRKRNRAISQFTNDPNNAVLVVTLEAAYQSRDYTLNTLVDNQGREIDGVVLGVISPTWHSQQMEQLVGRSQRQMQLVPARNIILETSDTVEQGKGEGVRYTYLLGRVALSGVALNDEDRQFIDSKRIGARILRRQSPESLFFRDAINVVRGAGEGQARRFMGEIGTGQERSNAQRFADRFYDHGRDEYKETGHNAKMVAQMIREIGLDEGPGLSLGSGTLLLQRMLGKGLDNVDLNQAMMDAGWERASQYGGRMVVIGASELDQQQFQDGHYRFIDSAYALHWSRLGNVEQNLIEESERVAILSQIDRVQATGGALFLTLPEKAFIDDEQFVRFTRTLENHFGRRLDLQRSGKSFGVLERGFSERLGWSIVSYKDRPIDLSGLQLRDLQFSYDDRRWESRYQAEKLNGGSSNLSTQTPIIPVDFDRFEIVNPLNVRTERIDGTSDREQNVEVEKEEEEKPVIDMNFLRGESREDYESFKRGLIKPLKRIVGGSWEEVEVSSLKILEKLIERGRSPRNRLVAYDWILKEAERMHKNHKKKGGAK